MWSVERRVWSGEWGLENVKCRGLESVKSQV